MAISTIPTNNHTAENLSDEIIKVLQQWRIENKVNGLVGDNTATMPKTIELMQQEEGFSSFEFWGCVGHLLNLVVKHSIEEV